MVAGIESFKKHFKSYLDKFVIIGGVACYIIHKDAGFEFRATKDFDIVCLVEKIDKEFSDVFMDFIKKGKYSNIETNTGKERFFRFYKPISQQFPFMLELFTKKPDILDIDVSRFKILKIQNESEVLSLSGIVMIDEYYNFIKENKKEVSGLPVVNEMVLIPLKARAYLDLTKRKELGERVDSRDIKKHKNDVFRLFRFLDPSSKMKLNAEIKSDMLEFIKKVSNDKPDLKNLDIKSYNFNQIIDILKDTFCLT